MEWMMTFFNWLTPLTYWLLTALWLVIIFLYYRAAQRREQISDAMRILLGVLLIDGIRTLIESFYFGTWYTARVGLLPESWHTFLVQPHLVIIPKLINLIAAVLVLVILLRRWLPQLIQEGIEKTDTIIRYREEIKQRELAETRLSKSEDMFRTLVESAQTIFWRFDPDQGKYLYISPQSSDLLGYSPESWTNLECWVERLHPDDREWALAYRTTCTARGENHSHEYRCLTKRGRTVWIQDVVSAINDSEGKPRELLGIMFDITEQKALAESLERNRDDYEIMLESSPAMIWYIDHNHIVQRLNTHAAEFSKMSAKEVIGKQFRDLFPHGFSELQHQENAAVFSSGKPRLGVECQGPYLQEGSILWFRTDRIPHLDCNGAVRGLSIFFTDISDQKEIQIDLQKTKEAADLANRTKSRFLATMSHEIRTPLNTILGMGELLQDASLEEKQREYVQTLNRSSEALLSLINDILDLSNLDAGQLTLEQTTFNLHRLIAETSKLFSFAANDKGIALSHSMDTSVPRWVMGDPTRLRQILLNLIGNAVHYTREGRVSVEVTTESSKRILFQVVDTGIGITESQKKEIFRPFTRVEPLQPTEQLHRAGLGLTICRRLVSLMAGELSLESQPGEGSSFRLVLDLPIVPGPEERRARTTAVLPQEGEDISIEGPSPSRHPQPTILIVDDSEDNRLLIQAFLKDSPYTLEMAVNGADAVSHFKDGEIDLVLMDIRMPIMDGYQATRAIREWEQERGKTAIPIIALTAHTYSETTARVQACGCDLHLAKPVRKGRLLESIRHYL
ncbi:MAG: PAS domain S-box protein [Magnetococcales bacterium]|nr:PAS domain S-box protein [Magnetococcales bacterium]